METAGNSQSPILTLVIVAAIAAFAVYRRTRQQRVRPARAVITAVIIIALSGAGLATAWQGHALAFELAPIAAAGGIGLGWVMMGTIRFWRDEPSGQLWMKGGALYIAIWLPTFVLRFAIGYAVGEYSGSGSPRALPSGPLGTLSIDLLFVSMGLWVARAAALAYRFRAFERGASGARR